ncbi:MAG: phosphodiesterase [Paracoccaceae bacterium]
MTTIVQLTATHAVAKGERAYGRVDTLAALECAVARIRALPGRVGAIDAVVVTGDLTDHGTAEEYAAFRALVTGPFPPLYVIPGNHDRREALAEAFPDADYLPRDGGPLDWCVRVGDLVLAGLDTVVPGAAHGALSSAQLDRLDARLAEAAPTPAIVFTHHPPFDTSLAFMDAHRLRDGEALIGTLARHGHVRLVASGHVHRAITAHTGGVACHIAPAPAHAVALDHAADAEPRLVMEPGAMTLHRWRGGTLLSETVFVAAGDGGEHAFADPPG